MGKCNDFCRNDFDCRRDDCRHDDCRHEECKKDNCEKIERCAREISARNIALIREINKKTRDALVLGERAENLRAEACRLDECAEKKLREVECLLRKLEEMTKKADFLFGKAIECCEEKEEDDECGCWGHRR